MDLRLVAQEPDFVVVDKPSGLLSVPGRGPEKADCVIARVRAMVEHASGPMMVHRLDMETSGLLVVALTPEAQRALSRQFEDRLVEKEYIALLEGHVTPDRGEVRVPMRLDVDRRPYQIADFVQGRPATTRFEVLERGPGWTRVRFSPQTGRSHQLRLHSALPPVLADGHEGGLGCPILGDPLYGRDESAPRLMLHASRLGFTRPADGARVVYECPAPF